MGIFSLDWFRSERRKELEALQVEEQKMKNDQLRKELKKQDSPTEDIPTKVYTKLKLVNDVLTIVLKDGNVISKPKATAADFQQARIASSEADLFKIASSSEGIEENRKKEAIIERNIAIVKGIDELRRLLDFEVVENTVYFRGIKRSLPPLLVEKFAELAASNASSSTPLETTEEYAALKRFFLWCCLNPRAEVVDKLYDFLTRNKMKITKQGFFVGLRNVSNVGGNNHELVDFITNAYQKIKGVWKKKPSNYFVFQTEEGEYGFSTNKYTEHSDLGNLETLYLDLPNMKENRYTDGYSRTMDIRIGRPVNMPPEECSWSLADCAEKGLHFAGHTSPYVLYGDTTVFTLHNPMKVVGIGQEKGRCWEYLPFMTTTVEEADNIMNAQDFDFLELDEQYAIQELEGLEEKAKDGFAKEAMKYDFNIPQINSATINKVVVSLDSMRSSISNRVVNLVEEAGDIEDYEF